MNNEVLEEDGRKRGRINNGGGQEGRTTKEREGG